MKILWIYLGGHHQTGQFFWVIALGYMFLFKVKVQNGNIF